MRTNQNPKRLAMNRMLPLRNESRAKRIRRGVAWHLLQKQKSRRIHAGEGVDLQAGLLQFYQVVSGTTHLRSWNESEELPDSLIPDALGFGTEQGLGGTYQDGNRVDYLLYPFRETG